MWSGVSTLFTQFKTLLLWKLIGMLYKLVSRLAARLPADEQCHFIAMLNAPYTQGKEKPAYLVPNTRYWRRKFGVLQ